MFNYNILKCLCISLVLFIVACSENEKQELVEEEVVTKPSALEKIKQEKKLVALTRYNANSYFLYKGAPMGFEYDLLKLYAEYLGVQLEIKVPQSWDSLFHYLNDDGADLIAANLTVTRERQKSLLFAEHHNTTRQVLVQRKPKNYRVLKHHQIEKALIREPLDLLGDTISVRKKSSYLERLDHLMEELGGEIFVDTMPENMETEQLIRMVAEGKIKYTLADENIAFIQASAYRNLDWKTPVSFRQRIAWAVKPEASDLKQSIDAWMKELKAKKNPKYYVLYNKYFKNRRLFYKRTNSKLFSLTSGQISTYDHFFHAQSDSIFTWTLLASQAYQESQFDSSKVSWAGARGVMQLMPATAEEMKLEDWLDPGLNIRAGARYMRKLYREYWKDLPQEEAIKFTLASYNAGAGHVFDAQRLASKLGGDPNVWEDVRYYLLRLSDPKFYYMDVVKHGYCRGSEPVNYVDEIIAREKIYQDFLSKAEESLVKENAN